MLPQVKVRAEEVQVRYWHSSTFAAQGQGQMPYMTPGAGNRRLRAADAHGPETPPALWARCGARCGVRPGWVHRGWALGEAPQLPSTLHNLRRAGRRPMRSEDPGFCKWDYHHAGIRKLLFLDANCPRRLNPTTRVSWTP